MHINPLTAIDFYKADHRRQYPKGTTEVYSNFTPRNSRLAHGMLSSFDNKVVFFGLQYFIKNFLIESWGKYFFSEPKEKVLKKYQHRMDHALGIGAISCEHISKLHDLGYLPIRIKALPEGARIPIGVPLLTIVNTHPDFFWLTNYLESVISCYLWKPITSATTAYEYKKLLTFYAMKTGADFEMIPFQAHDFSFRGMSSLQDTATSGAAHLTSFYGTDSVTAIDLLEDYYMADASKEPIGMSVPATEHSVMCMGEKNSEIETFCRLITEIYPSGIVSIVSDTWDFWQVIAQFLPKLKSLIMHREGKVVIRPDSGDPVKIITGDTDAKIGSPEFKGAVECLWEIFGGHKSSTGHKVLDSHIGMIYGDSITLERAENILKRLDQKGFASSNIVFGIGSFTYQYVTRDTFSFAMKATNGIVNGNQRAIFKDPKTDASGKKSARGLLRVEIENDEYVLYDNQTPEQEGRGLLKTIFEDGKLMSETSLSEIRARLTVLSKPNEAL